MNATLRYAGSAFVAGLIGLSPAFAQNQAIQDQIDKRLQELRAQEAKKTPATTSAAGDATATLKKLAQSSDPKTAALAKELLDQLAKISPRKAEAGQFFFQIVPSGDKQAKPAKPQEFQAEIVPGKPGQLELRFGDQQNKPAQPRGQLELRIEGQPQPKKPSGQLEFKLEGLKLEGTTDKPTPAKPAPGGAKPGEPRVVMVGEMQLELVKQPGPSTLKMSADGKTAAVVGHDGTVTVFDVASGKELMKFPGKK
ncbi:MAG TPA: hypothetical protein VGL71_00400 [Urbifossiella sp.]|jgi:hypothetical protein